MRLSNDALLNSRKPLLQATNDHTKEENCSEISPNLIISSHSTVSMDDTVGKSIVCENCEGETRMPEKEGKQNEKNISLNEEQLKTTFEGHICNSMLEKGSLEHSSKESIQPNTNSSKDTGNKNELNSATSNIESFGKSDRNLDAVNVKYAENKIQLHKTARSLNAQLPIPNNAANAEIYEQSENSILLCNETKIKKSSSFSMSNTSNAIKRNAPAIVMSLFGKKPTTHKDFVYRPPLQPKPTSSLPLENSKTSDSYSSSKNVNPVLNVGTYKEDNIPNKGDGDGNNKQDVNGSGTSSSLIPNVRGPVWQAFVASNSNNNTLTNRKGGSVSNNETNKMPVASPTSIENNGNDSSSSNKTSKTMRPSSKNVLGDQMDNNIKKCNESINKNVSTDVALVDAAAISSQRNNSNTDMSFSTMSSINNNESENEKHVHILTQENITNEKEVEDNMGGLLQDNTLNNVRNNCSSPLATSAPLASDEDGDSGSTNNDLSSSTFSSQQTAATDQDIYDETDLIKTHQKPSEHLCAGNSNKTPVLRIIGERTPPGTLKKKENNVADGQQPSAKSWCSQYSQAFLAKTIETGTPSMDADFAYNDSEQYELDAENLMNVPAENNINHCSEEDYSTT